MGHWWYNTIRENFNKLKIKSSKYKYMTKFKSIIQKYEKIYDDRYKIKCKDCEYNKSSFHTKSKCPKSE